MGNISSIVQIISNSITSIGILVGAIWSYHLFIKNRQKYPKTEIFHEVEILRFPDEQHIILTIHVTIKNTGNILLKIQSYIVEIFELYPSDEYFNIVNADYFKTKKCAEVASLTKMFLAESNPEKSIELEPTESERITHVVIVEKSIKSILLKSFFSNPLKSGLGWYGKSTHNLLENKKNTENVQ